MLQRLTVRLCKKRPQHLSLRTVYGVYPLRIRPASCAKLLPLPLRAPPNTSRAEAIIRPKVKGFIIPRSARDPVLARAESAAAAIVAKADRFTRAPCSTVGGSSSSTSDSPNSGERVIDAALELDGEGREQPTLPGVDYTGKREVSDPPGTSQKAATEVAVSDKEMVDAAKTGIEGAPAEASTAASAPWGEVAPEEATESGKSDSPSPAPTVQEEPSSTCGITDAAPSPAIRKTLRHPDDPTPQTKRPQTGDPPNPRQHQQPRPPRAAGPAPAVSVCDEVLSHRPKARAVIIPRPHTHHARKRPARRGGQDRDVGPPGPGEYDVGMVGGGGWGAGGVRGPWVAPKRYGRAKRCWIEVL